MIKIPESIRIGTFTIQVILDANLGLINQTYGVYEPILQRIKIENDKVTTIERKTNSFFHEVLEAINHIYDLKLDHHKIRLIATGYTQALENIETC